MDRDYFIDGEKARERACGLCDICGADEENNSTIDYTLKGISGTYKRQHAIDHCHETGRVRGVLCLKCNLGVGYFRDNITHLLRAVEYLQEPPEWK